MPKDSKLSITESLKLSELEPRIKKFTKPNTVINSGKTGQVAEYHPQSNYFLLSALKKNTLKRKK